MKKQFVKAVLTAAVIHCSLFLIHSAHAAAGTFYWRGGTDSNWSTAGNWTTDAAGTAPASVYPKDGDTAIFDGSSGSGTIYVDAGVADLNGSFKYAVVSYLTLDTGFAGTVELQKPLCVHKTYTQNAGTFTCGEHKFRLGSPTTRSYSSDAKAGQYYLRGGTFNAPSSDFEFFSVSHQLEFEMLNGGFNHNNGTFIMECSCVGGTIAFKVRDIVFNNFICRPAAGFASSTSINSMAYTNTVLGSFTHTSSRFTAYNGCFHVLGADLTIGGKCDGGEAFLLLDNDVDQTITTAEGTTGVCPPLYISKPAGKKVTFTGGGAYIVRTKTANGTTTSYRGFELMSGDVDMSALSAFGIFSYHSNFRVMPGTTIVWPPLVKYYGYLANATKTIKDQTFQDFYVAATDSRLDFGNNVTNTILGTLHVAAGGMSNDKSYYILKGDYVIDATYDANHAGQYGGGNAWVVMNGANDQKLTITNGTANALIIDKPENSIVTLHSKNGELMLGHTGTSTYIGGEGAFNMKSGVLDLNGGGMMFTNGCYSTVQHTGGTILWGEGKGLATYTLNSGHSVTLGFDSAHPLPRLESSAAGDGASALVISASQGLYVTNLVQNGPRFGGPVHVLGDHLVTAKSALSGGQIHYNGDADQTFTREDGAKNLTSVGIYVNKTGGELKLNSDMVSTGYEVMVNGGRVNLNGHVLQAATVMSIGDNGRIYQPKEGGQAIAPRMNFNEGAGIVLETSENERAPVLLGTGTDSGVWFVSTRGSVANTTNWVEVVGKASSSHLKHMPLMETKGEFWISGVGKLNANMPYWHYLFTKHVKKPKVVRDDKFMYLDWEYRADGGMMIVR